MSERAGRGDDPGRRFSRSAALPAHGDDTAGRTEPEPIDVYGDQAEADWAREPLSDELLAPRVRLILEAARGAYRE